MSTCVQVPIQSRRESVPLELAFQVAVSCRMCVLSSEEEGRVLLSTDPTLWTPLQSCHLSRWESLVLIPISLFPKGRKFMSLMYH